MPRLGGPFVAAAVAALLTSAKLKLWTSGTIDPDHQYMSDVDGAELSTTGYASGFSGDAITLTSPTATYDPSSDTVIISGALGTFAGIGVPDGVAVTIARIYIPGSSYADSRVLGSFECAATLRGGNFVITADAVGLATIAV